MFLFFFATGAQAECCWCECNPECHCPMGMDWGGGNDCSNPCGNVDCVASCGSEEPGQYCSDSFTDECPTSAPAGRLCRIVEQNCNQVSGCKKYELCNPNNGTTGEYVVSDSCHLENGTCYSNQRNCSLFGEYNWLPVDGTQFSGVAEWVAQGGGYKWDVGNCTSRAENKEYAFTNCDRFSFHGIVRSQNRYIANVDSRVTYTVDWEYCTKCKPGAVLTIMNSPTDGVVYRPTDIPGNWGGAFCWEPVHAPNYADGCEIDFSKPTGEAAVTSSSCTKSCSAGYATQEDGATSDNDCEFDTSALFHDATGDFTLGNMTNCPTNGG